MRFECHAVEKGTRKVGKCWNYSAKRESLGEKMCGKMSPDGRYLCSRAERHKGKHHAHALGDVCVKVWKIGAVKK